MQDKQRSRINVFRAQSHLANQDDQTREQKALLQVKLLKMKANRNQNRLLTIKMLIDNAK